MQLSLQHIDLRSTAVFLRCKNVNVKVFLKGDVKIVWTCGLK